MSAALRMVVAVGEERSRQFGLRMVLADSTFDVGSALEVGIPERDAADGPVTAGDIIVIRGVERLQPGQRVTILTCNASLKTPRRPTHESIHPLPVTSH